MRIEGTLVKWNNDRGFGFIAPTQGGPDVFVHVSAFPKDGMRPSLGERLAFEIELDKGGKKRAVRLECLSRIAERKPRPTARPSSRRRARSLPRRILALLVVVALVIFWTSRASRRDEAIAPREEVITTPGPASSYACDGRTHCSEMRSCQEATFFLRNCPGVQMDGDYDGVPCEQQWCTGQ